MYSMETFLYRNLNIAARNQDQNKIISLGAYAKLVADITSSGQEKRIDKDFSISSRPVYRGVKLN